MSYAISLLQIQKILQGSKGYILPRLPETVAAVLVDEGQLIPLLDLTKISGGGAEWEQSEQEYQVFVESEYGTVALPADLTGRIVAEQKGLQSTITAKEKNNGTIGKFVYQSEEYNILDINFLAIEMTQGFWQNRPDTCGARRHQ